MSWLQNVLEIFGEGSGLLSSLSSELSILLLLLLSDLLLTVLLFVDIRSCPRSDKLSSVLEYESISGGVSGADGPPAPAAG